MKLKVNELKQITSIEETLNLDQYISETVDLIKIENTLVKGNILKDFNTVKLNLEISCIITQKCNITLKPVIYPLSFKTEIIYSDNYEIMDYYLQDEIDLEQLVFAEIIVEKEPAVYHKDANLDTFKDNDPKGHPAFKVLKDLKKEEE